MPEDLVQTNDEVRLPFELQFQIFSFLNLESRLMCLHILHTSKPFALLKNKALIKEAWPISLEEVTTQEKLLQLVNMVLSYYSREYAHVIHDLQSRSYWRQYWTINERFTYNLFSYLNNQQQRPVGLKNINFHVSNTDGNICTCQLKATIQKELAKISKHNCCCDSLLLANIAFPSSPYNKLDVETLSAMVVQVYNNAIAKNNSAGLSQNYASKLQKDTVNILSLISYQGFSSQIKQMMPYVNQEIDEVELAAARLKEKRTKLNQCKTEKFRHYSLNLIIVSTTSVGVIMPGLLPILPLTSIAMVAITLTIIVMATIFSFICAGLQTIIETKKKDYRYCSKIKYLEEKRDMLENLSTFWSVMFEPKNEHKSKAEEENVQQDHQPFLQDTS